MYLIPLKRINLGAVLENNRVESTISAWQRRVYSIQTHSQTQTRIQTHTRTQIQTYACTHIQMRIATCVHTHSPQTPGIFSPNNAVVPPPPAPPPAGPPGGVVLRGGPRVFGAFFRRDLLLLR